MQLGARLVNTRRETILLVALGAAGAAMSCAVLVLYDQWAMALGLFLALLAVCTAASTTIGRRLAVFFSLLAVADFVKRLTFLAPDQSPWSQYLVYVVPTLYYGAAILLPALPRIITRPPSRVERLALLYLVLAVVMTWLSPGATLMGRLAASGFLLLPWTMILVSAGWGWDALPDVSRTFVAWGAVSALYGLWLFAFGPTPVELRWADAAYASIGAQHLLLSLSEEGAQGVWRVSGLQADAFTFGLFLLTALVGLQVLAVRGETHRLAYTALTGLLFLGIGLSLVRTIWVGVAVLLVTRSIAERSAVLRRPRPLVLGIVGMFLLAPMAADFLYQRLSHLAAELPNPLLARMLTFGTLDARRHALTAFIEAVPERLMVGFGYGISPWVTGKFGSTLELPPDFGAHNVVVEQLWYVGLPGLLIFLALLYCAFAALAQRLRQGDQHERRTLAILGAALLGLLATGLGNGGVFLNYPFFFLLGAVAAEGKHGEGVVRNAGRQAHSIESRWSAVSWRFSRR